MGGNVDPWWLSLPQIFAQIIDLLSLGINNCLFIYLLLHIWRPSLIIHVSGDIHT